MHGIFLISTASIATWWPLNETSWLFLTSFPSPFLWFSICITPSLVGYNLGGTICQDAYPSLVKGWAHDSSWANLNFEMFHLGNSILMRLTTSSCYMNPQSSLESSHFWTDTASKTLLLLQAPHPVLKPWGTYISMGSPEVPHTHWPVLIISSLIPLLLPCPSSPNFSLSISIYPDAQVNDPGNIPNSFSSSPSASNQSLKPMVSSFLICSMSSLKILSLPSTINLWTSHPSLAPLPQF